MGRPTDYSQEVVEKARAYLTEYEAQGDVVPTVAGLAITLGMSRETMYAWSADPAKQEFSDIVKQLMARQERGLSNGSLRGDLNATIAKLMLSKHGYADKQEVSGPDGGPVETSLTVRFVDGNPDTE